MPAELATIPAKAGRFTGERIARTRPRTYRKIISLLAADLSVNEITQLCRVSEHSVNAIAAKESESIAERKLSLLGLASRIAHGAGEVIENDIAAGKIRGSQAVIAFGVGIDKYLALTGEPSATIKVDLTVTDLSKSFQDLAQSISDTLTNIRQAKVIELPALTDSDSQAQA